jgi:hypothetical protein
MNLLGSFEAIQTAVRNRIEWLGLMSRGLPVKDQEDDVSDKICTELSDAYNLEFTEWVRSGPTPPLNRRLLTAVLEAPKC